MKNNNNNKSEWYNIRSLLGNDLAELFFLLGGREAGKSYAVTKFYVQQYKKYGRPFYWIRLTESSAKKLLSNNAEKLIDADIKRQCKIDIYTKGDAVYEILKRAPDKKDGSKGKILEQKLMCRVLNLSTFYNDKGSALFDKDFLKDPNMFYNICLDEMNREQSEKKTFDILYAFVNQLENIIRSTKTRMRVICIGNTLDEASDILCGLNFIPDTFGRYSLIKNKAKLKQMLEELKHAKTDNERLEIEGKYKDIDFGKRAIIEYIQPSDKYLTRRKGTIADILMPNASTFTNKIEVDQSLVSKQRLIKPVRIIKFSKDKNDWFTVWDDRVVAKYHNENLKITVAMRPYIDELFEPVIRDTELLLFNNRFFKFKDLMTFKEFQKQLSLLKPNG